MVRHDHGWKNLWPRIVIVMDNFNSYPTLPMSSGDYYEQIFSKLLDGIVSINPYLSAPYLEITDKGAGVYEIVILMHVQQPTGDTHNVETEFDSSIGTSTE
jgi:hypothetical protein